MLSCTEISFVFAFSILRNSESNPGFLLCNSSSYLLKTWKKVILTCFTKTIAEQSSVIQYHKTSSRGAYGHDPF